MNTLIEKTSIGGLEVVLSTRNLGKYFYDPVKFKALDNVSFDAYEGEFLTLVGKSGSGKSTLLYCLSTMDTVYEGELYIKGEKITGKKPDELAAIRNENIGFVFQFHYLLPEFTCLKNVMIPARRLGKYGYEEIEHKAYEKLKILGLQDQALKPASKLSGGQQQRVAIARALINDPAILMGDEPTGNLDSKNSAVVFDIFKEISSQYGQTIIAVTHDNDFAKASDRTIELADGRIIDQDKNDFE
ncbi:ATP-binding cassette domain-containing protein [Runella sp. CRIBMP]|uniref:ABC transporter ATP-binding protein n=1 Tax=Runella sp. CRIBMP TaxID=2683261 RepID=UPI001413312E|nr:ABC transporter ATP-binding protein [Runella sp. CRIBMP]NBB21871.1 ATP-binding cassette domain-containing protein [Runella sp. CRIBMP]